MGVVYRAYGTPAPKRTVALKLIAPESPRTSASATASCARPSGPARPSERRADPRRRRGRRPALHRDGLRRRHGPAPCSSARAALARAWSRCCAAVAARSKRRTRARARPPRREAVERPARRSRARLPRQTSVSRRRLDDDGPTRTTARSARRRTSLPSRYDGVDGRRSRGRLFARLPALRMPHWRAAVPPWLAARGGLGAPRGGAAAGRAETARPARGGRRRDLAGDREGSRRAAIRPAARWPPRPKERSDSGSSALRATNVDPLRRRDPRSIVGSAVVATVLATGHRKAAAALFAGPTRSPANRPRRTRSRVVDVGAHPVVVAAAGHSVLGLQRSSSVDLRGRRRNEPRPEDDADLGLAARRVLQRLLAGPVLAADASGAWFVNGAERTSLGSRMSLAGGGRSRSTR